MLSRSVPVRPLFDQPLSALFVAGLSCSLSLWLTLRFCRELWPAEGGILLVLLGLTWESAKLRFGPTGLRGMFRGPISQRLGCFLLAAMTLVLMTGSVVASMANFSQADARDRQRSLASSRGYAEALNTLRSLDEQIAVLVAAADRDVAQGFRQRALSTSSSVLSLRRLRADASAHVSEMELHPDALASTGFFVSLGTALSGDPATNAERIRCISHGVIAVMLELIAVAALCLARGRPETLSNTLTGAVPGATGPSTSAGVRCRVQSNVSRGDAVVSTEGTQDPWSDSNLAIARKHLAEIKAMVTERPRATVTADWPARPDTTAYADTAQPATETFEGLDTASDTFAGRDPDPLPDTSTATGTLPLPDTSTATDTLPSPDTAADALKPDTSAPSVTLAGRDTASDTLRPDRSASSGTLPLPDTAADTLGPGMSALQETKPLPDTLPATIASPDTSTRAEFVTRADASPLVMRPLLNTRAEPTVMADAHERLAEADTKARPAPSATPKTYLADKMQEAKVLVAENQVAPTCRALMRALRIGQGASQRLLAEMQAEGLLKRAGRRYQLVA